MKKISKILTAVLATAMIPTSGISANAQEPDYSLWEKFLKYDLCITDYSSLTEEEKELCKFIFETEQSADETLRCERARRMIAHDENIGDRITLEQLDETYGLWDNYSKEKWGWQLYTHCVPDIVHLNGTYTQSVTNEYWLDDNGSAYVEFNEKMTADDAANFDVYDSEGNVLENIPAKAINSQFRDIRMDEEITKNLGFIEKNGGYYYIRPDNTAVFSYSKYGVIGGNALVTDEPFIVESEINGCPVVAVEHGAFTGSALKEIILPDTIEIIDSLAFSNCTSLEKINLPENLKYLGKLAFNACSSLKNIDVNCPELELLENTFSDCSELESAYINVKKVGSSAFYSCDKLSNVSLGENVTYIDAGSFENCKGLEAIELPEGLKTIGQSSFAGSGVKNITIPPAVEIIGTLPDATGEMIGSCIDIPATHPLTDDPVCVFNSDCVISGYRGTEAERYAKEWNLTFVELEAEKGDVNLDGEITVADAVTLQNYLLGRYVKTGTAYGDMDDDGRINAFDMIMIRKKLVENQ